MSFTKQEDNVQTPRTNRDERKEAEGYGNPGLTLINPVSGEKQFISLPYGVPIDTQTFVIRKSKDPAYNALQAAKKRLLDGLQAKLDSMEPGESCVVPLEMELRKRARPVEQEVEAGEAGSQIEDFLALINGTGEDLVEEEVDVFQF